MQELHVRKGNLFFHAIKYFEVKKFVRELDKVTYTKILVKAKAIQRLVINYITYSGRNKSDNTPAKAIETIQKHNRGSFHDCQNCGNTHKRI